ncbi:hypothetical protein ACU4GD_40080 [Cupriavidus basilensis]
MANAVGNDLSLPRSGYRQGPAARCQYRRSPTRSASRPTKKWFLATGNRLDRVDILPLGRRRRRRRRR